MVAYDRCTNLEKKILPVVLLCVVEAENFSDHPHIFRACPYRDIGRKYVDFI